MKKPKKSKSARRYSLLDRLAVLRPRLSAFMLDWASWGYVAYGVMYLLNKYWYLRYVNFYGRLTLPAWGWTVVILATFELAMLSHAFGQSIGLNLFGLKLLGPDYAPPRMSQRLRRYVALHLKL
ncbi:MAG: RDD family protein, partial [Chloroflexi bacterium]|nr:RDD family protein [Chloroflexota bacterium]